MIKLISYFFSDYRLMIVFFMRNIQKRPLKIHNLNIWCFSSNLLELWEMWSNRLVLSLPSPLWTGLVAPVRVLSKGQIELFDIKTVLVL